MANALTLHIKEDKKMLQALLRKYKAGIIRSRITMLLICKKSKENLSKHVLAQQVGVNHNSIQKWRQLYIQQGIDGLLKHKRGGKRRAVITQKVHRAMERRLKNPKNDLVSFKQLRDWVDAHYLPKVKYVTVNSYIKRHFGAKLKIARKSHILKDDKEVEDFKKNSNPYPRGISKTSARV